MAVKPTISPPDITFAKKRYVIVRHVGGGGFADVWLANDTWLRRPVTLKVPKSTALAEAQAMIQEAISAARLFPHPHVLTVLDVLSCRLDGHDVPALVTEYVDGCDAQTFAAQHLARRKDALTRTALGLHVVLAAARGGRPRRQPRPPRVGRLRDQPRPRPRSRTRPLHNLDSQRQCAH